MFRLQIGISTTILHQIETGVLQGSVLGPILYLLFYYDLPTLNGVLIGTFADDTAILSTAQYPHNVSAKLQRSWNDISQCLETWRIRANETKSVNITFTLFKKHCPAVSFNGIQIPQSKTAK